jgi:sialidase-1
MTTLMDRARPGRMLVLVLFFAFSGGGCSPEQDSHPLETILFATPEDSSVACYRIPALEWADGVLLAAIDERVPSCADLRGNRDSNILMRRSMDGGRTWQPAQRIMDYADGYSASDASFIVDREQKRVFMLVNVMDHDRAPGEYRFHVIHSDDAGASWSEPRDITDEVAPADWKSDFKFITSGHGTQAPDGTLLHTMVNLQRGVFVVMSEDHGASWTMAPSPVTPGDESKIIAFDDGRWMVNSRVQDAGHRWVHVSNDRGRTWISRPDSSLVEPAVNASLVRTKEGLLYVGANHPTERRNLTMRFSTDEGQNWTAGPVIHNGSAAYVSAAALPDGDVGLFYEREDYTENVFVRVDLP